ncbi:hypothetical protein NIES593_01340 [Hydrococcus rivularis NIES-593]|uniref:Receptor ligand binding region domain-containing protein n=2 Tax=Hydrococcus TaxID=1616833 RepID=A0A1U7HT13_9CYAN|nr:hypothetical protein NIES593_01340 [Hydrococcus rivularis NIES-593]
MCQDCQEVIEKLQIDQDNIDRRLICLSLLGYTPSEIAEITFSTSDAIRSRLAKKISPRLENLMEVDSLRGNWTRILNFLLARRNRYRLDLPPLPKTTFFLFMSMGGKFLLNRNEIDSLTRIGATESYLITPSNACDTLSNLVDSASFFRIRTPNRLTTQYLAHHLVNRFKKTQRLAIFYNQNSIYSSSFKESLCQHLQNSETIQILPCCQALDRDFLSDIKPYIEHIRKQEVNILVIVPNGGIEKTFYNAELISAANINDCLIVGSATFAYQNILDWLDVNISSGLLNRNNLSNFLFVVPWHWRSQSNGFNSNNSLAVDFCKLADRLWGKDRVNWRSATAYDSVLIVIKILERNAKQNCHTLFENMHQFYKDGSKSIQGITGTIQFDKNGDRINPPTEILTVQWSDRGHCEFIPIEN